MAQITASMVKELREKTDAPMMECKKALTEADGDLARAEEILRVKLGNKASKAAARVTAEGLIGLYIADDGKTGAVVEVNCETDFVAKQEDFQTLGNIAAHLALERGAESLEALLEARIEGVPAPADAQGKTLDEYRRELVAKIGENITVRRVVALEAPAVVGVYLHGTRIGSMVALSAGDEAVAKDIAMHVAAINPTCISAADVPAEDIERERAIFIEQAKADPKNAGKPEDILGKIIEGRVRKWLNEVTLLGQPFVKDDKQTVEQYLKKAGAEVTAIVRYEVGAGIEKKQEDFAAEVAKALQG